MEFLNVHTRDGVKNCPVYKYYEINYTDIAISANESKKRGKKSLYEIPCAFDIETTNIYKKDKRGNIDNSIKPFAFMYHWQLCIDYRVIFGRTWSEFIDCLNYIERNMNLSENHKLVIYVHNLNFEFQFMRRFLNVTDSFCKDKNSPLKIVHNNCIEFRCSAALSNMSLDKFCKAENAIFTKLTDGYDYKKIRTPKTELTQEEKEYCYCDVRGLCECIRSLMRFDTLSTIPLTSTGYIRRDIRNSMRTNKVNRQIFTESKLDDKLYMYMRAAFRGGNTHANALYTSQVVKNVASYDIKSSYPACMMINDFPLSPFTEITVSTFKKFRKEQPGKFLYIIHCAFLGLKFTAQHGNPYIPLAKTKGYENIKVMDNGRIREADCVTMWLTCIDFDIILKEYSIEEIRIDKVYMSRAGKLPEEFRSVVKENFIKKETLKKSDEYFYNKAKNKLNSSYGMMVMRIDQQLTEYKNDDYVTSETPVSELLEKYYKSRNSFLPYQWGVFVTAHARKRLEDILDIVGSDNIYDDTDSCKFINSDNHIKDIEVLNEKLKQEAIQAGAYYKNSYMGVFDYEGMYEEFKTLGAKKYIVKESGLYKSTVAGVNKKRGQEYFNKHGIDAFKIGAMIKDSGHMVAYYNDDEIHSINIYGVEIETASNLCLIDDSYTIGVTGEYYDLYTNLQKEIFM